MRSAKRPAKPTDAPSGSMSGPLCAEDLKDDIAAVERRSAVLKREIKFLELEMAQRDQQARAEAAAAALRPDEQRREEAKAAREAEAAALRTLRQQLAQARQVLRRRCEEEDALRSANPNVNLAEMVERGAGEYFDDTRKLRLALREQKNAAQGAPAVGTPMHKMREEEAKIKRTVTALRREVDALAADHAVADEYRRSLRDALHDAGEGQQD